MTTNTDLDASFLSDFRELSRFGATANRGVERQAGSAADQAQREWFADWLHTRGYRVHVDGIGNQFGLLEHGVGLPYVLAGSHLDSQPSAGRFDGAYGVLAAAHAMDRLRNRWEQENQRPDVNVAVVNWFNEEGSRFKPSMMGSSVFTGKLPLSTTLRTTDADGVSVLDVLDAMHPERGSLPLRVEAYAEVHIEQGRELENHGASIGVVRGTWAAEKFELVIHGEQSHTGATLMADRRDALLGAATLITSARELADAFTDPPLHTSVSELTVEPNSPVVVARQVRMHVDFRSPDLQTVRAAIHLFEEAIKRAEALARVTVERVATHAWPPGTYASEGVRIATACAEELGLAHRDMLTIAGHDSVNMNDEVLTVMMFVPSKNGISHNELEDTDDDDLCNGVDVLTRVVDRLAWALRQ